MDGSVTINGQTGRLWLCKRDGGHALGLHVRVLEEGALVDRLLLFRDAVLPQFALTEARLLCVAIGTACDIECSICATRRTWWRGRKRLRAQKAYVAE